MVLRCDLTEIYRRLYTKLSVKQAHAVGMDPGVSDQVQPVIDVADLLWSQFLDVQQVAVGATGVLYPWTCPVGFEYKIQAVQLLLTAGTFTFNMLLYEPVGASAPGDQFTLDGAYTGTTDRRWPIFANNVQMAFTESLRMKPGDRFASNINAFTAAGTLSCRVLGLRSPYY